MKFIKIFMFLLVGLVACSDPQPQLVVQQTPQVAQPEYTTHQNPTTNQQMVVFKDNSGLEQMMEYAMFMSLLNSMGDGGCWNCVYGRRDYYRPRNEINVYRQYNVVSDRSYRYNQSGRNYNGQNVTTNGKGATATSGFGNGVENKTLIRQPNSVGQTTPPPNIGQNGIQNTTLRKPTGMPPSIVKPSPPVRASTSSGIKNTTLTKKK